MGRAICSTQFTNSNPNLFWKYLTDAPRNNVLPVIWAPLRSAKLIQKVNYHNNCLLIGGEYHLARLPCCCYCWAANSLQSCLTLCDPMDCSPPGSSVHGIPQARILEWVAVPSSRGSSVPRDQTHVSCSSCIVGRFFTAKPPRKHVCVCVYSVC